MSETLTEPTDETPETDIPLEEPETDDEPDDDDQADDDPEEAAAFSERLAEVAAAQNERDAEIRVKAIERENTRHEKALEKAYGTEWDHVSLCPLCEGPGFMLPRPPGDMADEQFAVVTAFAGRMQPVDLLEDSKNVVCQNCGGWGEVKIAGSMREGLSLQCEPCLGRGYVPTTAVVIPIQPVAPVIPQPSQLSATVTSYGAPGPDDQWGRPSGHTHYGIPPAALT